MGMLGDEALTQIKVKEFFSPVLGAAVVGGVV